MLDVGHIKRLFAIARNAVVILLLVGTPITSFASTAGSIIIADDPGALDASIPSFHEDGITTPNQAPASVPTDQYDAPVGPVTGPTAGQGQSPNSSGPAPSGLSTAVDNASNMSVVGAGFDAINDGMNGQTTNNSPSTAAGIGLSTVAGAIGLGITIAAAGPIGLAGALVVGVVAVGLNAAGVDMSGVPGLTAIGNTVSAIGNAVGRGISAVAGFVSGLFGGTKGAAEDPPEGPPAGPPAQQSPPDPNIQVEPDTQISPAPVPVVVDEPNNQQVGPVGPGPTPGPTPGYVDDLGPVQTPDASACFTSETLVLTGLINGNRVYKKFGELKEGDTIAGVVFEGGAPRIVSSKILKVLVHEQKAYPFMELQTRDGSKMVGTSNHPVIVNSSNGAVQLRRLIGNENVVSAAQQEVAWNGIVAIKKLPSESVAVFNLETETENYVVSSDANGGVLVHNGGGGGK